MARAASNGGVLSLSDGVYRLLLAAYPKAFRHRYAAPMAQVFRDTCRLAYQQSGVPGVMRLWLPAVGDFVSNALAERIQEVLPMTSEPRVVLSDPGVLDFETAAWMDGRYVAYTQWDNDRGGVGELALRDIASGEVRRLTNTDWQREYGFNAGSALSPDGKHVAYGWWHDGLCDLRLVGIDGAGQRLLYRDEEVTWVIPHGWTPDGEQVLASLRTSGEGRVALVSLHDGSARVLKPFQPGEAGVFRSWRLSPDGRHIAYSSPQERDPTKSDIFLLAAEGSRESALVQHPADDRVLAWTPDGKSVLFASDRGGTLDAWTIRVADGEAQGAPELVRADIAPLGSSIMPLGFSREGSFYYGVNTQEYHLYLAGLDPAGKVMTCEKLVSHVDGHAGADWSPEGEQLVYARGMWSGDFTLVIRSPASGQERELSLQGREAGGHGPLRWFLDGRAILAYCRDDEGREAICRVDAESGRVTSIVHPKGWMPSFQLSPDGKTLFYSLVDPDGSRILRRDLETGREEEVYRPLAGEAGAMAMAVAADGQWLAFTSQVASEGRTVDTLNIISTKGGPSQEGRQLARGLEGEPLSGPAWTPDGRYLLFVEQRQRAPAELWRVAVAGGDPESLGLLPERQIHGGLSLHPDGQRLAFVTGTWRNDVWVLERAASAVPA